MISLELLTIQHKDTERAWLSANVDQFLSAGGEVDVVSGFTGRVAPYNHFTDTRAQAQERFNNAVKAHGEQAEVAAKIRQLAKTKTCREICLELGMTRGAVRHLAHQYRISFQVRATMPKPEREPTPSKRRDAQDAKLLRTYAELGTSLNHAAEHSGIGRKRATRLAEQHNISFPPYGYTG
ncbi:hypothetical protein [Pseudomonas typographi]|uniref:hypothetical protein n=1 Tax=Pseudomonas typographi TaxID=2715964 RepID=UPI00168670C7|nr:hypothetical protein [Pseudomonas typographi]MBD1555231.1 hypothetical protein [Pseudomonas typographi]